MKRNIKFKAKRLDNGEWVKGDLIHSTSYVGISYPSDEFSDVPIVHRVDPKTVCMFTGLRDKNGKEIWEGDYLTPINDSEAMKVIFKEGSFGFDTSYYGMRFHPLAQYDIREGNKLVELILINRKEGEK
jgi:uncharacterized phage protein (TIGR01671 family)